MRKSVVTTAVALAFASAPAFANLVVNGSFEEGWTNQPFTTHGQATYTSGKLAGWTVNRNVDLINTLWQASDGLASVDLVGDTGLGGVSQVISTVAGTRYDLTFDLAGNPDGGAPTRLRTLDLFVVDRPSLNTLFADTQFFNTTGKTFENMGWTSLRYSFTAASDRTWLVFSSSESGCCWGAALDNVSVTAAVPEPESYAMLLAGLGLLGAVVRRRRAAA